MRGIKEDVARKVVVAFGAISIALLCAIERAHATVVSFDLNVEFSTGIEPELLAPWLNVTFDDDDTPGSVTLTMSDLNLSGGELVNNWNFNLDPSLDPTLLSFSAPTVVSGAFGPITPTTGENFFQADGDGFFDIMFNFSTTNGPSSKFGSGDAVSFDITGIPTLTAGSFNFLSLVDGNPGIFFSAAQVGGIGELDESGWIGFVPEPSTAALLIIGVIALLPIARRRIKR